MCHILASRAPKAARTGIRKFHEQSMVYDDGAPKKKAGKGRGATPASGVAALAVRQASKGQSAHEQKSCCACCGGQRLVKVWAMIGEYSANRLKDSNVLQVYV